MNKGTAWLRQKNEKKMLSFLRLHPITTRLEIGKALGVSKNTVSLIVEKFIQEGVVRETGIDEPGGVGRPRKQLSLVPESYKSIGIFVQKSSVQFVVTDYCSNVLEEGAFTFSTNDADQCCAELNQVCESLLNLHPQVLGIGIGIPGLVDSHTGIIHYSSQLGWKDIPLKDKLSELLVPIKVLNNVKASALAPISKILDGTIRSAFYIRIGKGVGGALIIENDLYHGVSNTAGEIGHFVVKSDGPLCICGQKGCLESLVSIPNIIKDMSENSSLAALIDSGEDALFRERGTYLGMAISQIIHLFNPQYVIVDSPLEQVTPFCEETMKTIRERTLQFPFEHTEILFIHSQFGTEQGAALAMILDFEQECLSD